MLFHPLSPSLSLLLNTYQAVFWFYNYILPPSHAASLRTLILNRPCALMLFPSFFALAVFLAPSTCFSCLRSCLACSHLIACSPLSSLASFLSSHRDVRSAAPGSGLGTSGCLVRLCLLCEVFSHIAAFHGLAWQITPPCVRLCMCVCVFGNTLYGALQACEFIYSSCTFLNALMQACICGVLLLPYFAQHVCERMFTVLICVYLE